MLIIILCAAGGNVATQLVMQKNMDQPLMLQNAILYVWGICFNGLNWIGSVQGSSGGEAFGDIGFREVRCRMSALCKRVCVCCCVCCVDMSLAVVLCRANGANCVWVVRCARALCASGVFGVL